MKWNAFKISELNDALEGYTDWFLDGGQSIDYLLQKETRVHEDLDIGVFEKNLQSIALKLFKMGFNIYKADGTLELLSTSSILDHHSYWVSDSEYYRFQILVYRKENNQVIFRRNKEIRWPIEHFLIKFDGIFVVNPMVIFAHKITYLGFKQKDQIDVNSIFKMAFDMHAQ